MKRAIKPRWGTSAWYQCARKHDSWVRMPGPPPVEIGCINETCSLLAKMRGFDPCARPRVRDARRKVAR